MLHNSSPEEKETNLEKVKPKLIIFLLGPGNHYLNQRKDIADKLRNMNYKVMVMEDEPDWLEYSTIVDKFHDLLQRVDPQLIVALFTKKGSPVGVTFEIGYICGYYGRVETERKLRFLLEAQLNEKEILSSYIRKGLFTTICHSSYYDINEIVEFIDSFARNKIIELGWA
jgi:hypothetical protein